MIKLPSMPLRLSRNTMLVLNVPPSLQTKPELKVNYSDRLYGGGCYCQTHNVVWCCRIQIEKDVEVP